MGQLFGLTCAGEQITSRETEIMVVQMKPPDIWFGRQRLNRRETNPTSSKSLSEVLSPAPLDLKTHLRTHLRDDLIDVCMTRDGENLSRQYRAFFSAKTMEKHHV